MIAGLFNPTNPMSPFHPNHPANPLYKSSGGLPSSLVTYVVLGVTAAAIAVAIYVLMRGFNK